MGFWEKLFGSKDEDTGNQSEEQLQNDVLRLAHLLVSEIKFNNEAEVYEGLRNADLYKRLKREIDRSRQVYEKQVRPLGAAKSDYFYEELVKTLAEGDASKLGPGLEGPRVKS